MGYFRGNSDLDQLKVIFMTRGTPTEKDWPGMESLRDYMLFQPFSGVPLGVSLERAARPVHDDAIQLVDIMLAFDPMKRLPAGQCLKHHYFANEPKPSDPG